jgi:GT2 family glycosyltransferase
MDISIIIINYNTFDLTSNCIRSIIEFTKEVSYEVILVDNASTECDPQNFLKEFPGVNLIRSKTNGGFAYGNNLGIGKATGEHILLLNSDTLLKEDSISKSLNYLKKIADAGVLGCRMTFIDGSIQHTARRFRSIQWELLDLFRFIPMLMLYKKRSRLMLGKYFRCDENIECDWVNGAFFMFPGKILAQLPAKKLDDRFFMYGEDQLWCKQIRDIGYKVLFYSETTIIHINSGSTIPKKQLSLRKQMMKHEVEIMYLRKGKSLYYYFFVLIYGLKETIRNIAKWLILKFSGRLIR